MRVLFIHQNFPGQFRHLAAALAKAGHEVKALAIVPRLSLPGVTTLTYAPARGNTRGVHPWAVDFETKAIRAEACAKKMVELERTGFVPDLVIGHPAWGETWLVKEVWSGARVLLLQEFFYGADLNFDPEFSTPGKDMAYRFRLKNACLLPGLESMDWGMSPTVYQHAQFPARYREQISVVFEGIDTDVVSPKSVANVSVGNPPEVLTRGEEIVTFVNRNLEPYRGYHSFMRALPRLFELRPQARVVIVGGEEAGYGSVPAEGTWREKFFEEVRDRVDVTRIHFVGKVPYKILIDLFRISTCHVYLTYPFVLSWSMLEAMSAGALVVGSRTGPVEEVITDGENGLLVDFFDTDAMAARIAEVLASPERFESQRKAARRTVVDRYALSQCLPRQVQLAEAVCEGRPPPTWPA
jgi:glycosyltransferase involved in cell wall biosynthesis